MSSFKKITKTTDTTTRVTPYNIESTFGNLKFDKGLMNILASVDGTFVVQWGSDGRIQKTAIIDQTGDLIGNTNHIKAMGNSGLEVKKSYEKAAKEGASNKKIKFVSRLVDQHKLSIKKMEPEASIEITLLEKKIEIILENLQNLEGYDENHRFHAALMTAGMASLEVLVDEIKNLIEKGKVMDRLRLKVMGTGIPKFLFERLTTAGFINFEGGDISQLIYNKNNLLSNFYLTIEEILDGNVLSFADNIAGNLMGDLRVFMGLVALMKQPLHPTYAGDVYDIELLKFKFIITPWYNDDVGTLLQSCASKKKTELPARRLEGKEAGVILGVLSALDKFNIAYAEAVRMQMYTPFDEEQFWKEILEDAKMKEWINSRDPIMSKVKNLSINDFKYGWQGTIYKLGIEYALGKCGMYGSRLTAASTMLNDDAHDFVSQGVAFGRNHSIEIKNVKRFLGTAVGLGQLDIDEKAAVGTTDETANMQKALDKYKAYLKVINLGEDDKMVHGLVYLAKNSKWNLTINSCNADDAAWKKLIKLNFIDPDNVSESAMSHFKLNVNVSKDDMRMTAMKAGLKLPEDVRKMEERRKKAKKSVMTSTVITIELSNETVEVLKGLDGIEFAENFKEYANNWLRTNFVGGLKLQPVAAGLFINNLQRLEEIIGAEGLDLFETENG